ncbi:unnamed protein product [Alternaria alternata]
MGRFPVLLSLFVSVVFAAPSEDSKQTCYSQLDGKLPSFTPSNFHFSGNVRRYYIAAEELEWDYAPTGSLSTSQQKPSIQGTLTMAPNGSKRCIADTPTPLSARGRFSPHSKAARDRLSVLK